MPSSSASSQQQRGTSVVLRSDEDRSTPPSMVDPSRLLRCFAAFNYGLGGLVCRLQLRHGARTEERVVEEVSAMQSASAVVSPHSVRSVLADAASSFLPSDPIGVLGSLVLPALLDYLAARQPATAPVDEPRFYLHVFSVPQDLGHSGDGAWQLPRDSAGEEGEEWGENERLASDRRDPPVSTFMNTTQDSSATAADWLEPYFSTSTLARANARAISSLSSLLQKASTRHARERRASSSSSLNAPAASAFASTKGMHGARGFHKQLMRELQTGFSASGGLPFFVPVDNAERLAQCLHAVRATPLYQRYYGGAHASSEWLSPKGEAEHSFRRPSPAFLLVLLDGHTGLPYCFFTDDVADGGGHHRWGHWATLTQDSTTLREAVADRLCKPWRSGRERVRDAVDGVRLLLRVGAVLSTSTDAAGKAVPSPDLDNNAYTLAPAVVTGRGELLPPERKLTSSSVSSGAHGEAYQASYAPRTDTSRLSPFPSPGASSVSSSPASSKASSPPRRASLGPETTLPLSPADSTVTHSLTSDPSSAESFDSSLAYPSSSAQQVGCAPRSARSSSSPAQPPPASHACSEYGCHAERLEQQRLLSVAEARLAAVTAEEARLATWLAAARSCGETMLREGALRLPSPARGAVSAPSLQAPNAFRLARAPSQFGKGMPTGPIGPIAGGLAKEHTAETAERAMAMEGPWSDDAFLDQLRHAVHAEEEENAALDRHIQAIEAHRQSAAGRDAEEWRVCAAAAVWHSQQMLLIDEEQSARSRLSAAYYRTLTDIMQRAVQDPLSFTAVNDFVTQTEGPLPANTSSSQVGALYALEELESRIAAERVQLSVYQTELADLQRDTEYAEHTIRAQATAMQREIDALEEDSLRWMDAARAAETAEAEAALLKRRALLGVFRAVPVFVGASGCANRSELSSLAGASASGAAGRTRPSRRTRWAARDGAPSWSRTYIAACSGWSDAVAGSLRASPISPSDAADTLAEAVYEFCADGAVYVRSQALACSSTAALSSSSSYSSRRPAQNTAARESELLLLEICASFESACAVWRDGVAAKADVAAHEEALRRAAHEWTVVRQQISRSLDEVESLKQALEHSA